MVNQGPIVFPCGFCLASRSPPNNRHSRYKPGAGESISPEGRCEGNGAEAPKGPVKRSADPAQRVEEEKEGTLYDKMLLDAPTTRLLGTSEVLGPQSSRTASLG